VTARHWALVSGIVFVLIGILGFVPSLTPLPFGPPPINVGQGYGFLFGIFPVNVLHNLVHVLVGLAGLAAYWGVVGPRGYARGLAVFYGLLTIMGLIPPLSTFFGLIPIFGADIALHFLTALVSAYFGWGAPHTLHDRVHDHDHVARV
jgi:hypothetical protein